MKDWKELTEEELANLTDDEIDKYSKLICAEQGIPFLVEPEKPVINYAKENLTVYIIKHSDNMVFTNIEEATKVMEAINKCSSVGTIKYNYGCRYYESGFKNYDNTDARASVQSIIMFDEKTAKSNNNLREVNKDKLNQYEHIKNIYDNSIQKRDLATEDFYTKLRLAKNTMAHRKKLASLYFYEYLPLAENNAEMAMNFLKKAYTVSEEDEKFIEELKVENE